MNHALRIAHPCLASLLVAAALWPAALNARDFRVARIPNGSRFSCLNCHVTASGGTPRNPFGLAVQAIVGGPLNTAFWTPALAEQDSDGDGFTNGQELGDPDGDGQPTPGAQVTRPGDPSSTPTPPANESPRITLSAPADGATFIAPAVQPVSADASDTDGSVAKVEFFDGERLLGVVTQAPFSLLVDWGLGPHAVSARATDNQGATAVSATNTMTVNAPEPITLGPATVSTNGLQVAWTGGGGPFALQTKSRIADPWCALGDFGTNRSATAPVRGTAGFVRVADVALQSAVPLTALLGGAFERPIPLTNNASGSGTFKLEGNTLTFDVRYAGLSGPAIMAHIHGPADTETPASVLINLAPFNGGSFGSSGTLSGSVVLTSDQKAAILSGKTYVNVHTEANQGGEIRGQVMPVLMQAMLSGENERPDAISSGGSGTGQFLLTGDQLSFNITYGGLSGPAIMAHIHGPGSVDESVGVLIDLAPFNGGAFGAAGSLAGTVTLSPEQLLFVISGRTYVNIHTDANQGGEIRGQIFPCATAIPFSAALAGAFERPTPVTTTASGSGTFRLEGDVLSFDIRYGGLSGPAIMAHIHGPADAQTPANVLIDLSPFNGGAFGTNGTLSGSVVLTAEQKTAVLGGMTYVNVHTDANQGGEIRGQIAAVLMEAALSGTAERPTPIETAGAGSGLFLLAGDRLTFNVTYGGLSGPAMMAHIHGPADAQNFANVLIDLAPFNGGAFGVAGSLAGAVTLTPEHLAAVVDGLTYVNVHTGANQGGEIRGQILRSVAP